MTSQVKGWKTYQPAQPQRSKNIKPEIWEAVRDLVSRLHHEGKTKNEILNVLDDDIDRTFEDSGSKPR